MSFYRSITLDHTQAGASDTLNFVLPFGGTFSYLATVANGGQVTSVSGYDIVFCTNPSNPLGTKLNFERVNWSATTGLCEFWVQVPTLSHTTNTVIYLYYGDSSITTDQQNAAGTWDSSIYVAVYHFGDGTTLNLNDSTANALNGTNHGAAASASLLGSGAGGAIKFVSASLEYVDLGASALFNVSSVSLQMIAQANVNNALQAYAGNADGTNGYQCVNHGNFSPTDTLYIGVQKSGTEQDEFCNANAWASGNVASFWGTYDGTTLKAYRQGTLDNSGAFASALGSSSAHMNIGRLAVAGLYADANIDELRVSKVALSADRITAEFNAITSGSTFTTIGPQTTLGTNARVQQVVIELLTLNQSNARVQQAVVEILTLVNKAVNTAPFSVVLRGIKRVKTPKQIVSCSPLDEERHNAVVDELTKWID